MKAQCDMSDDCTNPVTHIGEKGYIYCKEHALDRRRYPGERTRLMRVWELQLIAEDKPLPTYRRLPKAQAFAQVVP